VAGAVAGGLGGKAITDAVDPKEHDAYWQKNYNSRPYYQQGKDFSHYAPPTSTGTARTRSTAASRSTRSRRTCGPTGRAPTPRRPAAGRRPGWPSATPTTGSAPPAPRRPRAARSPSR
jgi:hypothetical protein